MADPVIASLRIDGAVVAEYADGSGLPADLGPRPHLHPVRTLGGRIVTDARPSDHPWHLGFSLALQDVGGWNLWGGRTYVRDQGYVDLDDHGRIEHVGFDQRNVDGFDERLRWLSGAGEVLLAETRRVAARSVRWGWELAVRTAITNATERLLALGSPATNGRTGAGYGGLFWRLPPITAPQVFTEQARGETGVHGSVTPWLAWTDTDHTLALTSTDGDPWFVRVDDYPGVGLQLAPSEPVVVAPGASLVRSLRALIADDVLTAPEVASWAGRS